jgi:hypothetical protein
MKCTARNGSYVCQYESPERHTGYHYAYFVSGNEVKVAFWIDHYSRVHTERAPVPTLPAFTRPRNGNTT